MAQEDLPFKRPGLFWRQNKKGNWFCPPLKLTVYKSEWRWKIVHRGKFGNKEFREAMEAIEYAKELYRSGHFS